VGLKVRLPLHAKKSIEGGSKPKIAVNAREEIRWIKKSGNSAFSVRDEGFSVTCTNPKPVKSTGTPCVMCLRLEREDLQRK